MLNRSSDEGLRLRLEWPPQNVPVSPERGASFRGALAHPHQALYAQDQWQGRALHPNQLPEWAYALAYNTSKERAAELPRWLHRYNVSTQSRPSADSLSQGITS